MELAEYLSINNISITQFARLLGVRSPATVARYVTGERMPSPKNMEQILRLTSGRVTPIDFMNRRLAFTRLKKRRVRQAARQQRWDMDDDTLMPLTSSQIASIEQDFAQMMREPTDGADYSPILKRAMRILGADVRVESDGSFRLNNRLVDARKVVQAANRILRHYDQPALPYPGV